RLPPPAPRPYRRRRWRRGGRPGRAGLVPADGAGQRAEPRRRLGHRRHRVRRPGRPPRGIAFGATAAAALIPPAVFRLVLRRWRWMRADDDARRAHAAWREFHDDLADFGMTSPPSEPPRHLAARGPPTGPRPPPAPPPRPEPAAAAVTRLALAEERASYAARPAESQNLRRDG